MNIIKIIIAVALISLFSCDQTPKTTNKQEDKLQQVTQTKQDIVKPEKYIDFFGVAMYGEFKSLMDSLEKKHILKVDRDSTNFAVVGFCGARWGLNIDYKRLEDNLVVTSIIMLTSNEPRELIDSTYNRLFDYYGEPYSNDTCEAISIWFLHDFGIVSRYLRVEEGGSTICFELDN